MDGDHANGSSDRDVEAPRTRNRARLSAIMAFSSKNPTSVVPKPNVQAVIHGSVLLVHEGGLAATVSVATDRRIQRRTPHSRIAAAGQG